MLYFFISEKKILQSSEQAIYVQKYLFLSSLAVKTGLKLRIEAFKASKCKSMYVTVSHTTQDQHSRNDNRRTLRLAYKHTTVSFRYTVKCAAGIAVSPVVRRSIRIRIINWRDMPQGRKMGYF